MNKSKKNSPFSTSTCGRFFCIGNLGLPIRVFGVTHLNFHFFHRKVIFTPRTIYLFALEFPQNCQILFFQPLQALGRKSQNKIQTKAKLHLCTNAELFRQYNFQISQPSLKLFCDAIKLDDSYVGIRRNKSKQDRGNIFKKKCFADSSAKMSLFNIGDFFSDKFHHQGVKLC